MPAPPRRPPGAFRLGHRRARRRRTDDARTALPGHPHFALPGRRAARRRRAAATPWRASMARRCSSTPSSAMLDALAAYQRGFAGREAHDLLCDEGQLLARRAAACSPQAGCGFDIVSGGELARVLAAGAEPAKIIFSGVGKTRAEMRQALAVGIGCFNVESEAELDVLNEVAVAAGPARAGEHPRQSRTSTRRRIPTSPPASRATSSASRTTARSQPTGTRHRLPGLKVVGIDCHIGSQITDDAPYLDAWIACWTWCEAVEAAGIALHHIDFGGGLGIDYNGDTAAGGRCAVAASCSPARCARLRRPAVHHRTGPLAGRQRRRAA